MISLSAYLLFHIRRLTSTCQILSTMAQVNDSRLASSAGTGVLLARGTQGELASSGSLCLATLLRLAVTVLLA